MPITLMRLRPGLLGWAGHVEAEVEADSGKATGIALEISCTKTFTVVIIITSPFSLIFNILTVQ